jgi:hypothetical protein
VLNTGKTLGDGLHIERIPRSNSLRLLASHALLQLNAHYS